MIPTHRGVVVAPNGVAAASQPLAVSTALNILQHGGTFADAAIAASAVLVVIEPYASHLGGDAFMIVYDGETKKTTAFNASGAAPSTATPSRFAQGIPLRGLASASVPGLVDSWFALHERYGHLPIESLLSQAIIYADEGFPAGYRYAQVFDTLYRQSEAEPWIASMARTLTGLDTSPRPGQTIRQPDLAWTLSQIANTGRDAFYQGQITERLLAFSETHDGLFGADDFANYRTQISDPIRTDYHGYTIHGQPPVSQGMILLEMLNIVEGYPLAKMGWDSADALHLMVEAKKLAFADRAANLGDPEFAQVPIETLLSKQFAAERRAKIDRNHAAEMPVQAGELPHDTTYFCIADSKGNAVSFIQSVFHGFGCGVVADRTGVLFNNRMTGFSLDPSSPNLLAPGKRPAHTLNAYVVTRGEELAWVGGTPGGDVQVQSNLQVLCNVIDYGMNPQQAIEAPRWQHGPSTPLSEVEGSVKLQIEARMPEEVREDLARKGHDVETIGPWAHASNYQLVAVDPDSGAYHAGSDPRGDGHAAGY